MHNGFIFSRFLSRDKRRYAGLFVLWIVGLLLGIWLCVKNSADYNSIIYTALIQKSPLIYRVLLYSLALLIIALLCHRRRFTLMIPIPLLLSVSKGFAGMSLYMAMGTGAWVLRILFLFANGCISILIWWLILLSCNNRQFDLKKSAILLLIIAIIVSIVDYSIISPFMADVVGQII